MTFKFSRDTPQWWMRITPDRRLEVNEDLTATEAAQKVLDAMQVLLRPPPKWTDAEMSNGCCGIRWVNAEGVQGVPTREDVEKYLGYASQPAQRAPASMNAISAARRSGPYDVDDGPEPWAYTQGWRGAEKHHDIKENT